jgi:ABC-type sugar transport system permease subunit
MSLLLLAGLATVPEEMQEAAKVDGATAWQRLWKVTLPNMKGAILVALLFRSLDAFRIFDTVYVQTAGATARRPSAASATTRWSAGSTSGSGRRSRSCCS